MTDHWPSEGRTATTSSILTVCLLPVKCLIFSSPLSVLQGIVSISNSAQTTMHLADMRSIDTVCRALKKAGPRLAGRIYSFAMQASPRGNIWWKYNAQMPSDAGQGNGECHSYPEHRY